MSENNQPYKNFGERVKFLREQWQQTISEMSYALEISENSLISIEEGKELPEPETFELIVSHFLLTDDQAEDLRSLAYIDQPKHSGKLPTLLDESMIKQLLVMTTIENRIAYTDGMHANVNDHGVILHFTQNNPGSKSPVTVSKIGMSHEHARKIIEVLEKTITEYEKNKLPKQLPEENK